MDNRLWLIFAVFGLGAYFFVAAAIVKTLVPVTTGGLNVSPDGKTITLEMKNVPVVDQPQWPALDSIATPARVAFKMVWKSTGEPVLYENASRQFRFKCTRAGCQLKAQVKVPSIGYSWKSDALETSRADFAVMGEEVNGRYDG